MSTNSILHNVNIKDKEQAEQLVKALEQAEQLVKALEQAEQLVKALEESKEHFVKVNKMQNKRKYIDAGLIKKEIENKVYGLALLTSEAREQVLLSIIDNTPSADVVEVKHGYWYYEAGDVHSTGKYRYCSICGGSVFIPYFSRQAINNLDFDYCPNCSAKMDGE